MPNSDESGIEQLSQIFGALGNPTRLTILSIIGETKRPLHIKAVARALRKDYAAVYRHVDVLKKAGLVQIFEVGRSRVLSQTYANLVKELFAIAQQIKRE